MKLPPERLAKQLSQALAPVYLIAGDEPLQHAEAADAVRHAAREAGYSSREVMDQDARFDWNQLAVAADSLSLFSERRVLDLRLTNPKIGAEGSKALVRYLQRPPPDTLLLITSPRMDRAQLASKWAKSVESAGVLVQVWPVDVQRLPGWIERRMRARGLNPAPGAAVLLAERAEGNLLAAAQEIEKLLLLQGPGSVSPEQLLAAVGDSARFDVYALVDAALQGRAARVQRILLGLRGEGVAEPVVLWALAREIRTLAGIAAELDRGEPLDLAFNRHRVWEKRKPLMRQGLKRFGLARWRSLLHDCAEVDRILKGRGPTTDPWQALAALSSRMAGVELPARGF